MNTLKSLLNRLADGKFHSGEEIAQALGISRSAIWKTIQNIKKLGISCHSIRGRGYVIPGGLDLLDKTLITSHIDHSIADAIQEIKIEDTLGSTNSELRLLTESSAQSGTILLAEQQTAGRGRSNKPWVSPFADGIALSLLWQFDKDPSELSGLSLAVGVAIAKAIQHYLSFNGIQLKWPNDILVNHAKLGGVLIDLMAESYSETKVIIGIGINVKNSQAIQKQVEQPITDLAQLTAEKLSRNILVAQMINHLVPMLNTFQLHGFSAFHDAWQSLNAFAHKKITIQSKQGEITGICQGVNNRGALLLLDQQRRVREFLSGEVIT